MLHARDENFLSDGFNSRRFVKRFPINLYVKEVNLGQCQSVKNDARDIILAIFVTTFHNFYA